MKECLECRTEFEPKRDFGKFCSDKCRVKWHRKNPNKGNTLDKVQVQVLYNTMLDLLSSFKYPPSNEKFKESVNPVFKYPITKNYFGQESKITIRRTFENYQQLRKECENEEDWLMLKEEILNSDLSIKQITLLTS